MILASFDLDVALLVLAFRYCRVVDRCPTRTAGFLRQIPSRQSWPPSVATDLPWRRTSSREEARRTPCPILERPTPVLAGSWRIEGIAKHPSADFLRKVTMILPPPLVPYADVQNSFPYGRTRGYPHELRVWAGPLKRPE